MSRNRDKTDWRTIIRRIKSGKFTPIISYRVNQGHFMSGTDVVSNWADKVNYPLQDKNNLVRVAQFVSITSRDTLTAKEDYLDYLKEELLEIARDEQPADRQAFLDTLEDELYDLTLSQVAKRLGYPRYDDEFENPLRILAELPLPIYLTTNYSDFMEQALISAGKNPRTEISYWHEDLEDDVESVFEADPDYQPNVEEPLVFHIHGLDAHPSSLVLTEDDYLDFLVKVSEDPDSIPRRVAQALADSSLLLLGYNLRDWDFRVLFRGLIRTKRASRRLLSLSIQISPEDEEGVLDIRDVQNYLENYFGRSNFDIYWGTAQEFAQELWEQWES